MNKPLNPLLHYFYVFLAILIGVSIASVPVIYLQSRQNRKMEELKQLDAAQENVQRLLLEEKKKEAINIIDKQLEEMKAEDKARKEALGQ